MSLSLLSNLFMAFVAVDQCRLWNKLVAFVMAVRLVLGLADTTAASLPSGCVCHLLSFSNRSVHQVGAVI